ncbi:LytR C-terminal domain-containing protein [Nocardioides sp. SYSU DS0651]|uniref:LytR C-terminal domain-containing protein n=1 Tax=Nocardioides sp. SYSU DS0651 TaxID=3415955 RepID=UPI003F4B2BC1
MDLDLNERGRSALTLAVLAVVFLGGVTWAWSKVTEPFPERVDPPPCTDTLIAEGEDVTPPQVMVSVLNAGGADGLANKTMARLVARGFGEGRTGNAPAGTGPLAAEVWASDPGDPAAILVASYLGKKVEIVDKPSGYPGITIAVGKGFGGVKKGRAAVTAQAEAYVCTPPLSTNPEDVE